MVIIVWWIIGNLFDFAFLECTISTQTDLNEYQPLILRPGSWPTFGTHPYYLPVNREGELRFKTGDQIVLNCPSTQIKAASKIYQDGVLQIVCSNRHSFEIPGQGSHYQFRDFQCVSPAAPTVRRTKEVCNSNNQLLEIGFLLKDGRFIRQITVCFDPVQKRTFWSHFNLTSAIQGSQHNVQRQMFQEGGSFYNLGVPVEQCYYIPRQRATINQQLCEAPQSTKYIDKGETIFTRGHLTAKADFVYGPQQLATFYWVNVAPQWACLNNGNWNDLEKSVRDYATLTNKDFVIYTGTHELASVNNVDLFLHCDDVNHIPVPNYFWKVVYEPESKSGVAFVGVNNPFEPRREAFCRDVCNQMPWQINWERDRHAMGIAFCCEVDDFRRHVRFPMFTVSSLLSTRRF